MTSSLPQRIILPFLHNSTYIQFRAVDFMIQILQEVILYGVLTYLKMNVKYAHLDGLEKWWNFVIFNTNHSWIPCSLYHWRPKMKLENPFCELLNKLPKSLLYIAEYLNSPNALNINTICIVFFKWCRSFKPRCLSTINIVFFNPIFFTPVAWADDPIQITVATRYITTEETTLLQSQSKVFTATLCNRFNGNIVNATVLLNNNPSWTPEFGVVDYYITDSPTKVIHELTRRLRKHATLRLSAQFGLWFNELWPKSGQTKPKFSISHFKSYESKVTNWQITSAVTYRAIFHPYSNKP